jgi:hypothetical protein
MRLIFTKLLVCGWLVLAGTGTIQAQAGDQLSAVRSAIASGSSHDLAQYLSPSVEVGFDGDSQNMNATQTELVLKNFFAKNAAGKFDIVHQGAGPDGTPYAVGRYTGFLSASRPTGLRRPSIKLTLQKNNVASNSDSPNSSYFDSALHSKNHCTVACRMKSRVSCCRVA